MSYRPPSSKKPRKDPSPPQQQMEATAAAVPGADCKYRRASYLIPPLAIRIHPVCCSFNYDHVHCNITRECCVH